MTVYAAQYAVQLLSFSYLEKSLHILATFVPSCQLPVGSCRLSFVDAICLCAAVLCSALLYFYLAAPERPGHNASTTNTVIDKIKTIS